MQENILQKEKLIIKEAVNSIPITKMLNFLIEECGELITAIQHLKRNRIPESKYILELIHVKIMVGQALEKVNFGDYQTLLEQELLRLDERTKNRLQK